MILKTTKNFLFLRQSIFRHRERDKEDRKKWDSNSDRMRRNSGNIPPLLPQPLRGAVPTTPQRPPVYGDPRGDSRIPGGYGDSDRWNQRDR